MTDVLSYSTLDWYTETHHCIKFSAFSSSAPTKALSSRAAQSYFTTRRSQQ
jgi:hypothetical protein